MPTPTTGGSVEKALKREKGAALRWRLRSSVTIQAIGRGTMVDRRSLYRSFADRVGKSKKVSQLIDGFCVCSAIDNCNAPCHKISIRFVTTMTSHRDKV